MKNLTLFATLAIALSTSSAVAQSNTANIRVQPGYFCAINKCLEFSDDLTRVNMQARVSVSVAAFNLRADPVISEAEYRQIFRLALIQRNKGSSGR